MAQSRQSYDNGIINKIRQKWKKINSLVEYIKLIYFPAQKGIK